MEKEQFEQRAIQHLLPPHVVRTREQVMKELHTPCGRFADIEPTEDRLALFIAEQIRHIDPLGEGQHFVGSGFPLNWQRILAYLHTHGIISEPHFTQQLANFDRPRFHNFFVQLNDSARKTDGIITSYAAFGASSTQEEAISKTVGEALERYFLSIFKKEKMVYGSYDSFKGSVQRALDISQLNGFSDKQRKSFPELAWTTESPMYWVTGERYQTGEKTMLPAQLVFWNYRHGSVDPHREEKVLVQSTTSGCAGHFSKREAVLSGILELIQRDAFLIFWLNHLSPPVLDVASMKDPEIVELLSYCKRYRLELTFLNTTADIAVPSVTCVITDNTPSDGPYIAMGGGTGFDLKRNIIHSALEALSVSSYSATLPAPILDDSYVPFADKSIARDARLGMWKGQKMAERFAFFTSGARQDPQELLAMTEGKDDVSMQLDYVLGALRKLGDGYDVYTYEAQDEVLSTLKYHVLRTIVPQLIPLHLVEYAATIHAKRLKQVPELLGYKSATTLNPWPHPFP